MTDQCCCGRFKPWPEGEESIRINDTVHEEHGPEGASCGPWWRHEIRDQQREIERLRTENKRLLAESYELIVVKHPVPTGIT